MADLHVVPVGAREHLAAEVALPAGQRSGSDRPGGADARRLPEEIEEPPTPLADEPPDGVGGLSPGPRRTVLDLWHVLVVAEAGGTTR
ncbi:hypothetical protein GMA12_10945 [Kocuria sediminis]|uniref:Uncharacterized protein n=1 Tax=Kocuria sediminis TaxID=1038857 RepID=A0A6N8GKL5_9MICC|nr:hypothetical protein [Kocuria sediminis]MUN63656.1 hypothetical protein [Kocuria sediminis]